MLYDDDGCCHGVEPQHKEYDYLYYYYYYLKIMSGVFFKKNKNVIGYYITAGDVIVRLE